MAEVLRALPGNPSSMHAAGARGAGRRRECARGGRAAGGCGCGGDRVHLGRHGGERAGDSRASSRICSRAQRGQARPHVVRRGSSTRRCAGALAAEGAEVSYVAVGPDGRIDVEALRAALRPTRSLVTLALANHELGNIYDIAALARAAHEVGALFHTDAVQAAGKIDVDVDALGVDALTLPRTSCTGPRGWARLHPAGAPFAPLAGGGHQERERRAGTENVSGIVGFGVAARLAARGARARRAARIAAPARSAGGAAARDPGRAAARRRGQSAAGHAERRLRGRAGAVRRRGAGPRGDQRVDGRGVHVGIAGAVGGAAGARVVAASRRRARSGSGSGRGTREAEIDRVAEVVEQSWRG